EPRAELLAGVAAGVAERAAYTLGDVPGLAVDTGVVELDADAGRAHDIVGHRTPPLTAGARPPTSGPLRLAAACLAAQPRVLGLDFGEERLRLCRGDADPSRASAPLGGGRGVQPGPVALSLGVVGSVRVHGGLRRVQQA